MLIYLNLILSILSLFFIGYMPTYFLLLRDNNSAVNYKSISGKFFIFFISFYIGSLIATLYLIVLSLMEIEYGIEYISSLSLIFFALFLYWYFSKRFREREKSRVERVEQNITEIKKETKNGTADLKEQKENKIVKTTSKKIFFTGFDNSKLAWALFITLIVLIVINFLVVVFFTVIFPIRFWDAISCWSLKGKAFFIDGIINNFYSEHSYDFSHPSYPLYLPIIQSWIYFWMGQVNENLVKIIFPLFYASTIFTLYHYFRLKLNRIFSVILVFIFSAIPIVIDHGYIEYTNLLFSTILILGVYSFYLGRMSGGKGNYLVLSTIFFATLALIRSEGITYMFLFLLLNLIFFFVDLFKRKKFIRNLLSLLVPVAMSVVILLPWLLLKIKLNLPLVSEEWLEVLSSNSYGRNIFNLKQALSAFISESLFSTYDSTRAFFSSFYGPVWVILFILFIVNVKRIFKNSNWIVFTFILFGFVTIFLSLSAVEDFVGSIDRYMLHLFPITYLWVMSNSTGRDLKAARI